jgi:phospholipid/cholesterol/gamma-HCH transport system substrate-binding protein
VQRYTKLEISVGLFVIAGALALAYLSISLGGITWAGSRYPLQARFASVGDLKVGDPVRLAGVNVGEVRKITLAEFAAQAELSLQIGLQLPEDTIASIKSSGLLGDSYVSLSPGGSDRVLAAGAQITHTEPAISITELIAKYAFGSPIADKPESAPADSSAKPSPFSNPLE